MFKTLPVILASMLLLSLVTAQVKPEAPKAGNEKAQYFLETMRSLGSYDTQKRDDLYEDLIACASAKSKKTYPKAIELMESFLDSLKKVDARQFITPYAQVLINEAMDSLLIGLGYYYQGKGLSVSEETTFESIESFNNALLYLDSVQMEKQYYLSHFYLGGEYEYVGRFDDMIYHSKRSVSTMKELEDKRFYIGVMHNLGHAYQRKGLLKQAMYYYEKEIKLGDSLDLRPYSAGGLNNLGNIYYDLNNPAKQLELQLRSIKIHEEEDQEGDYAIEFYNIADTYIEQKEYDKALEYINRGFENCRRLNIRFKEAMGYESLVILYQEKGDYEKAFEYAEKALQIKIETRDESHMAPTYAMIADLYSAQGEYHKAIENYHIGNAYSVRQGNFNYIKREYIALGQLYRKVGDRAKAKDYLTKAFNLSEEYLDLRTLTGASIELSEMYTEIGDFKRAYYYEHRARLGTDSLNNEEMVRELTGIRLQNEFEREKSQLLAAQKEEELLLQSEIKRKNTLQYAFMAIGVLFLLLTIFFFQSNRRRKKDNATISDQKGELERSNSELKELMSFKQGMTDMIAHDIKNPLNSIIVLSRKLNAKVGNDIAKAGEVILRLITNMIDVEKFEQAKPRLELASVFLSDLVAEAKLAVELLLHDKFIQLHVNIPENVKLSVDKDMLVRVLVNLLSNAIKFSPSNDIIVVESTIRETDSKRYVKLGITDNGPGIPESDQPFLFEKFYQRDAKKSGLTPSTGLGLTFCKMAVMAHGGTILVSSQKNSGTTFFITLEVETITGEPMQSYGKDVIISAIDLQKIRKYTTRLKTLKIHNVSAIMSILDELETLNLQTRWSDHMRSAVQYADKEQYDELLVMIENSDMN